MNSIFNTKHWILIVLIVLGGLIGSGYVFLAGKTLWGAIVLACTAVGVVSVREHALVIRHENLKQ